MTNLLGHGDTALLEEGQAFAELAARAPRRKTKATKSEFIDVVVIGGGQAGLSVGHHLKKWGVRFVILDAEARTGDVWRHRWDSLELFTPNHLNGLDGMRFPGKPFAFPTKDEMGDYLEAYARRFELPIRHRARVTRLSKDDRHYVIEGDGFRIQAQQVVVAMASYQKPRLPDFAAQLRSDIVQIHSHDYRASSGLRAGSVLIAGAGNSGAEIARDLVQNGRRVELAGRDTGQVPFDTRHWFARLCFMPLLLRVVFHRILTVATPMGRRAREKMTHQGGPLIRTKRRELAALGVGITARVVGVKDGLPLLADGTVKDVANVVWSTGFHPGFSWIDVPVFGTDGEPLHQSGVVPSSPGLYFVGLHFLHAMSSTMIHGVGRDAARIAGAVRRQSVQWSVPAPSAWFG